MQGRGPKRPLEWTYMRDAERHELLRGRDPKSAQGPTCRPSIKLIYHRTIHKAAIIISEGAVYGRVTDIPHRDLRRRVN